MNFGVVFVFSAFNLYHSGNCARILASVSTPSYSHQVAFRPIWMELTKRGHDIVLITTDSIPDAPPNIRQIDMSYCYEILQKYNYSELLATGKPNTLNPIDFFKIFLDSFSEANRWQLEHPEVQQLIHNRSERFDVLMMEIIFPTHIGFLNRFKAPFIGLSSLDAPVDLHAAMGNDAHPVWHSDVSFRRTYPPTFLERISILFVYLLFGIYARNTFIPREEDTIRKIFGNDSKSIKDSIVDIDMLFINVNPFIQPARAVTPNTVIFGGGTHVKKVTTPSLPKELQSFLNNATDGFVYLSLGSNVKSSRLNSDLKKIFLETLEELPFKVLWKFETDLQEKPKNVMISKWVPQMDVLAHPNIKAFITQCGLQSLEEAMVNRVPMVALPFFGDQESNAFVVQNRGFGLRLEHSTMTKANFKDAILEVIRNPKYKKNLEEVAELMEDVEMTGLEKVVWWTEYVIRNKGAKLLRNPILNLPWYQYYLVDVLSFLITGIIVIPWGTKKILSMLMRFTH